MSGNCDCSGCSQDEWWDVQVPCAAVMAPHLGAVFVQCGTGAEVSLKVCNTRGGQQHLSLPVPPRVFDACAVVASISHKTPQFSLATASAGWP